MNTVVVESTAPMKAIMVLCTVTFVAVGLAGVLGGAFYAQHPFARIVFVAIGAGSLALAWGCARVLPFLRHRLEFDDEGICIFHRDSATAMPWASVRYRARDTLQVLELSDPAGRRIFAVDYWAHNVDLLLQRLDERRADGAFAVASGRSDARARRSVARRGGQLHHWSSYALIAVIGLAGGVGGLAMYDPEMGIVAEHELLTAVGEVAWVRQTKYGTEFALEGIPRNFRYPSKAGAMGTVRSALARAGSDPVTVRFESGTSGPMYSDVRYHDIWDVAVGGRTVRSYADTTAEWRADNRLMPWLCGFFAFAGVFCAFAAWLSYDQAARRRRS